MTATPHDTESVRDQLGEGVQNVLVLSPAMEERSEAVCADLLSVAPAIDRDVLFVTLAQSPDDRLGRWQSHADGTEHEALAFVSTGETTRSAGTQAAPDGGPAPPVHTVPTPGDLTGLGIEISERLEAWAEDDNQTLVCFHTVTTLLQYAEIQPAFQFFHVLASRVRIADARAHYHADPAAHDERTLNTMRTLFDAVVEWDEDGWTVRSR